MFIIHRHFQYKDTYIVGTLIKNGCQIFKIEDLDRICKRFEVRDDIKEEVRKVYEENSKLEEDWESLAHHVDRSVRKLVAKQGKCLDILVNDKYWDIRFVIAEQGYGVDILAHDPDEDVRRTLAMRGYGLDILINDLSWLVRVYVARQGYGLDILLNDKRSEVRAAAIRKLREFNLFKRLYIKVKSLINRFR